MFITFSLIFTYAPNIFFDLSYILFFYKYVFFKVVKDTNEK